MWRSCDGTRKEAMEEEMEVEMEVEVEMEEMEEVAMEEVAEAMVAEEEAEEMAAEEEEAEGAVESFGVSNASCESVNTVNVNIVCKYCMKGSRQLFHFGPIHT
jgi:hypothetical protein